MKAYSQDLRKRVVRAEDQEKPRDEVANLFHVSSSLIKRYLRQRREQGYIRLKMIPGRPPTKRALYKPRYLSPGGSPRCHLARVWWDVGRALWDQGQSINDEPCYSSFRMDAEKTFGARSMRYTQFAGLVSASWHGWWRLPSPGCCVSLPSPQISTRLCCPARGCCLATTRVHLVLGHGQVLAIPISSCTRRVWPTHLSWWDCPCCDAYRTSVQKEHDRRSFLLVRLLW